MPITPEQFSAMQQRLAPKVRFPVPDDAVEDEGGLHDDIIAWIKQQHPMPAYVHARMDKRSTCNKGVPDWIIFWKGHVFLIECKTKRGKKSPEQLAWSVVSGLNGFTVHECRSFTEFQSIMGV